MVVAASVFLALFSQSLAGFGLALILMPLLAGPLGIRVATPLVALIALISETFLLIYYRRSLEFVTIGRLAIASLVGIPFGIIALRILDQSFSLVVLGMILLVYSLYSLIGLRLPRLSHPAWAYVFGLLSGLFGGANNTSGPPIIIFGDCQQWSRHEFKANLQGLFVLEGVFVLLGHGIAGNLSQVVWRYLLLSLTPMIIGVWAGLTLDKYLDTQAFRRIILLLLILLGLRLIFF